MLHMLLLSALAALLFVYTFMPSLWLSIMAVDEFSLDAHEAGLAVVASRNPFRETGPPACMAKLIMLRHKIHQTNTRRRRSALHVRRSFNYNHAHILPTVPQRQTTTKFKPSWMHMRFGKAFGKQSH